MSIGIMHIWVDIVHTTECMGLVAPILKRQACLPGVWKRDWYLESNRVEDYGGRYSGKLWTNKLIHFVHCASPKIALLSTV